MRRFAVVRDQSKRKTSQCQRDRVIPTVSDSPLRVANCPKTVLFMPAASRKENLVRPSGEPMRKRVVGFHSERAFEERQRFCRAFRHCRVHMWEGSKYKV